MHHEVESVARLYKLREVEQGREQDIGTDLLSDEPHAHAEKLFKSEC